MINKTAKKQSCFFFLWRSVHNNLHYILIFQSLVLVTGLLFLLLWTAKKNFLTFTFFFAETHFPWLLFLWQTHSPVTPKHTGSSTFIRRLLISILFCFIACQSWFLFIICGWKAKGSVWLCFCSCNHLTSFLPLCCFGVRPFTANTVLQWFILLFCFYCKFCSFCNCREYFVLRVNKYIWTISCLWIIFK